MKSTRKQKLLAIIGFFLEFFPTHFELQKCLKKFWRVGWWAFLNIVSSPGTGFVKIEAWFGQVGD